MSNEFIKKIIEAKSGFDASCWVVGEIRLDIEANTGSITLKGYKDFDAKEDGKTVMDAIHVIIPDLSIMESYDAVKEDVLNAVFLSNKFDNATLEVGEIIEIEA